MKKSSIIIGLIVICLACFTLVSCDDKAALDKNIEGEWSCITKYFTSFTIEFGPLYEGYDLGPVTHSYYPKWEYYSISGNDEVEIYDSDLYVIVTMNYDKSKQMLSCNYNNYGYQEYVK